MKSKKEVDLVIAIVFLVGLFVIAEFGDNISGMISFENETIITSSTSSTTSSTSFSTSSSSSSSTTSSSTTLSSTSSSTSSTSTTLSSTSTSSITFEVETFIGKDYRRRASEDTSNNGIGSKKTVFLGGQKISTQKSRNLDNISGNVIGTMKENKGVSFILVLVLLLLIVFVYKNYKTKNMLVVIAGLIVFLSIVGYLNLSGNITLKSVSNYSYYEIDDIVIGDSLSDEELTDNDLDRLQDGELSFNDVNFHDEITFGRITSSTSLNGSGAVSIESSLSSRDYDYEEDLGMEIKSGVINYHYIFDESIDLSKVSNSNPLDLKFLGKSLSIVKINSQNEFKTKVGNENFMNVGNTKIVNGKNVTLKNIGDNSAIVDVDGVVDIVDLTKTKKINGVEVGIGSIFYSYNTDEKSAMLRIGEKAIGVYQDDDPYIGENDTNPDWIWDLGELTTLSSGDRYSSDGGPTIGVKNDFVLDDDKNSVKVGECINMPNDFGGICFNSITDVTPKEYLIHYDESCSLESESNQKCIVIETPLENGLVVNSGGYRTKKILLNFNETVGKMDVYFKNSQNRIQLADTIDTSSDVLIGEVRYKKTSQGDIEFHLLGTSNVANNMELDIQVNGEGRASSGRDDLHIPLSHSTTDFSGLRGIEWGSSNLDLASVDETVKGYYGYSMVDPEEAMEDGKIRLKIPDRQIKATVIVRTNELI